MPDSDIQNRITDLIDEEHHLRAALQNGAADPAEANDRLAAIESDLDRCWDLLRQRRAQREFHTTRDQAAPRDPGTVQNYQQ